MDDKSSKQRLQCCIDCGRDTSAYTGLCSACNPHACKGRAAPDSRKLPDCIHIEDTTCLDIDMYRKPDMTDLRYHGERPE